MNQQSIDELFERWEHNPDASQTAALCEALRGQRRPDLIEIVGSHASKQLDLGALLAAARMYTDASRLDDAQSLLLAAGRIAPRDGEVYRWLGEVLLRRGDAERAEKVLGKAIQFGNADAATSLIERARSLVPLQRSSGQAAVAEAVRVLATPAPSNRGNAMPPAVPVPAAAPAPPPSARSTKKVPPADSDEDVETQIRKNADVKAAIDAAFALPLPAAGRPPEPPPVASPSAQVAPSSPSPMSEPPPLPTSPISDIVFSRPTRGIGFDIQPSPQTRENEFKQPANGAPVFADTSPFLSEPKAVATTGNYERQSERQPPPASHRHAPPASQAQPPPPPPASSRAAEPPVNPMLLAPVVRPAVPVPEPRDVLDALQIAGVYEPEGVVGPQVYAWTKPQGVRRLFSMVTLGGFAIILVLGGIGAYKFVNESRAKAHLESEQLLANVDHQLQTSDAKLLESAEKTISRTFELESRSPHAALTWLRERALVGLLKNGADLAFEDAVQRARMTGVPEKSFVFSNVASFLYQGDTAGAAATIAKWDAIAQDDPWFQLMAGATFERAGDARSLERYAAAVRLDPELIIAQILLTRATTMDGDPRRAAELAREFRVRYPDRPEGAALVALAWTRDPLRGEPPAEIKDVTEHGEGLPPSLRAVPHAARAILSLHRGALDEAKPALQKGLDVADSPGIAAWLGSIALATGDDVLARKAALTAVSFSAVYPPARVLAARVALLGGRLDEALKATEDLPPAWADVAIVVAAASYEKLDGERMARAFDAIPEDAKKLPFVLPLVRAQATMQGNLAVMNAAQALGMADDEAPWADLVAMDWALDAGDIELAKKIATDQWKGAPRAMRAVRLARLARYDGRLDEADKMGRLAIESGSVTMRVLIERVYTLVAMKKDGEALALFKSYPNVGGPLAKWLRAYATAAHGKLEEARAMVAQEDAPSSAAPMTARILAAMAYAAMKDTRHGNEYTRPIAQAGFANPDVTYAAEKAGLGKIIRRR